MHTARLEGGIAIPVTSPQSSRFDVGGGLALAYELRPIAWIGAEARLSGVWLPSSAAAPTRDGYGSYYALALGARGYPLASLDVGDLWIGASAALVITGDVVRPGLEVGLGYDFDVLGYLRVGPFVRYHHVFQTEHPVAGGSDGGFVAVGVALAYPGTAAAVRDSDGDGLLDPDDRCPQEPEDADGFEDDNGCPDLDDDADGVADTSDACRTEPEDRDGFEDENGCPDADDDADGIPDASDACRTEPETPNGHDDGDGCPDQAPAAAQTATERELERLGHLVLFPHNRVQVRGDSRPAIRAVIRLLEEHPEIRLLRIEAHASREGTPEENMELSRRRAQTVIGLLVRGGIDPSRLTSEAFGDQQPEATGDTEEDHERNRRVVFVIVERGPAPAGE